jgi:N-acetylglucosaminyldiphosphoundecaprenol N-acetyl-beta-D-mannosaminyltransferase
MPPGLPSKHSIHPPVAVIVADLVAAAAVPVAADSAAEAEAVAEVADSDSHRVSVLGCPVDLMTRSAVIETMRLMALGPHLQHVVTLNPEQIMASRSDMKLRQSILDADLITVDGVGLELALKLGRLGPAERVTGVDLIEMLATNGVPLFLLGGQPGAAEEAQLRLSAQIPGARIVGAWSGGSPAPFDDVQTLERVASSGATAVAVAYGVPAQIDWIERNRASLDERGLRIAVGVGGALDFLSGAVQRAPKWVQRIGLEFLWRLGREPWRWRRQTVLPIFAVLAGREAMGRRFGDR